VTTVAAYKVVVKVWAGPTGVQEAVTVAPGSVTCWLFVSMFLKAGEAWIGKIRRGLYFYEICGFNISVGLLGYLSG
jgi:hypothetical protein